MNTCIIFLPFILTNHMFALYLILSEFNKQWQSTIDAKAAAEVKLAAELTASAQKYVSYV